MALIVSAASGNFNAGATWVGGAVPGVGDEAQAATGHTITITADATCDEVSNTGTGTFVLNNGVTLTANVTNKSTANSLYTARFNAAAPAQAWIVGNCTGNAGNNTAAAGNASTGTLNITGDCIGGSLNINASGAINGATGVLNITGNCIGGAGGFGANNSASGVLNITGNCTGGATSTTFGANNNSTGTMVVVGTVQASEFTGGVGGANRQQTTLLTGPFLISPIYGVSPISNLTWRWAVSLNDQTYMEVPTNDLLDKRNLVTPDNATNFPTASDVRSGVAYGIGGVVFGTCAVPDPSAVALGVPVSDTVGTLASQTAEQIADAVWGAASRTITGGVVDTLTNAPASVTPSDIWSHTTRTITGGTVDTLTNAPSVPSASAIADEVRVELATELARIDAPLSGAGNAPSASTVATAVRTELATELARVDAAVSTRLADADYVAPANSDVAAIKAKTDALNTERLANVATTAIVGNLIAQANS
jgi:hypothetical protein